MIQRLKRILSSPWISLLAGVSALACIVYLAVFSSPFGTRRVFDPAPFPAGPWKLEGLISPYDDGGDETLSIVKPGPAAGRYLRAHLRSKEHYAGVSIETTGISVPTNASLVFRWRASGETNYLQLDISDGSPTGNSASGGEIFSAQAPVPGKQWTTVEIPLHQFKRNDAQPGSTPADGRLDTDGIRGVHLTLPPYADITIDIRDIRFNWGTHRPLTFVLLAVAGLIGLFFFPGGITGKRTVRDEALLFDTPVAIRITHFLTAFSLIAWALFYSFRSLFYMNNFVVYCCFFALILFDKFVPGRLEVLRIWRLRYFVVLAAGFSLGISLAVVPLFLLLLACYIPSIQHRDRTMFLGILSVSFLVLVLFSTLVKTSTQNTVSILLSGITAALISEGLLRYRASVASKRSMSLYEDLFTNASDAIYILDSGRRVQTFNPGFENLVGLNRRKITGRNILDFIHPGDHPVVLDHGRVDGENDPRQIQLRFIGKNKELRTALVNERTLFHDDEITGYQLIARDITERQKAEEMLRESEEKYRLVQKMEAIGQLAGGIAHDFNNLLQVILGYTHLGLKGISPGERSYKDFEQVKKAAERAAALTRQLLLFGRRHALELANLSINTAVTDLSKILLRTIGEHIELSLQLSPDLDNIHADPTTIDQILLNLCINARDAMPNGGELSIETGNVTLTENFCAQNPWAKPGDYVLLTVSDTGTGMGPETLEHIFEPFFTTKEVGKGTGLGLSTTYGIVRQHSGHILCESQPGKGTRFKIYLPVSDREPDSEVEEDEQVRAIGGKETILVVEDDEQNRDFVTLILRNRGYTVLVAVDGEDALKIFEEHPGSIDLCVTDVVMPKLGGRELHDRVIGKDPTARFLFVSGYHPEELSKIFTLEKGMPLIQKPYKPQLLLKKVREILDKDNLA